MKKSVDAIRRSSKFILDTKYRVEAAIDRLDTGGILLR